MMWQSLIWLILCSCIFTACAVSHGPDDTSLSAPLGDEGVRFPPLTGPKRKIQVVQIAIPAEEIKRYPELSEKRVGFGLSHILVETLFDTQRFVFLEDKEQILKRLVELWELTEDGILVKDPVARDTALQAPEFLVYAEIFDFVPCSPIEHIGGLSKRLTCVTSVGVQVRIGNTATGEYIPGSSNPASPEGKAVHTSTLSLFGDARLAFDQSAVGRATQKAMRYAVAKALQRFEQTGW